MLEEPYFLGFIAQQKGMVIHYEFSGAWIWCNAAAPVFGQN